MFYPFVIIKCLSLVCNVCGPLLGTDKYAVITVTEHFAVIVTADHHCRSSGGRDITFPCHNPVTVVIVPSI